MITVFVWLSRRINNQKNVGHASMRVNERTYISWWPDESAGPGHDYHPIRNKDYLSDVQDEGCEPDWAVHLTGLDENAILEWWERFGLNREGVELQGPMPPYNLVTQNCSTVVARALKQGGGDKYASYYSSWSIVWRPQTILDYARSIQAGLNR